VDCASTSPLSAHGATGGDVLGRLRLVLTLTFIGRDRIVGLPTPVLLVPGLLFLFSTPMIFRAARDAVGTLGSDLLAGIVAVLAVVAVVAFLAVVVLLGRSTIGRDHVVLAQPLWGGRPRHVVAWDRIEAIYVKAEVGGIGSLRLRGGVKRDRTSGFDALGMTGPLLTVAIALEQGLIPESVGVAIDDSVWLVSPNSRRAYRRLRAAQQRRSALTSTGVDRSSPAGGSPRLVADAYTGRTPGRDDRVCDRCGGRTEAVTARYDAQATLDEMAATAVIELPMRRCPVGHISGWRPGDHFIGDLLYTSPKRYKITFPTGGVRPGSRRGSVRCGGCGAELRLVETGRSTGTIEVPLRDVAEPATFDCDLPEAVCRRCGTQPLTDSMLAAWIRGFIADAKPFERPTEVTTRTETR
jgi:hypothetical protein